MKMKQWNYLKNRSYLVVQESQYLLKIVECSDRACIEQLKRCAIFCHPFGFLPVLLLFVQATDGLYSTIDDSSAQYLSLFIIPADATNHSSY